MKKKNKRKLLREEEEEQKKNKSVGRKVTKSKEKKNKGRKKNACFNMLDFMRRTLIGMLPRSTGICNVL